jgi:hypothetical protein
MEVESIFGVELLIQSDVMVALSSNMSDQDTKGSSRAQLTCYDYFGFEIGFFEPFNRFR